MNKAICVITAIKHYTCVLKAAKMHSNKYIDIMGFDVAVTEHQKSNKYNTRANHKTRAESQKGAMGAEYKCMKHSYKICDTQKGKDVISFERPPPPNTNDFTLCMKLQMTISLCQPHIPAALLQCRGSLDSLLLGEHKFVQHTKTIHATKICTGANNMLV